MPNTPLEGECQFGKSRIDIVTHLVMAEYHIWSVIYVALHFGNRQLINTHEICFYFYFLLLDWSQLECRHGLLKLEANVKLEKHNMSRKPYQL